MRVPRLALCSLDDSQAARFRSPGHIVATDDIVRLLLGDVDNTVGLFLSLG